MAAKTKGKKYALGQLKQRQAKNQGKHQSTIASCTPEVSCTSTVRPAAKPLPFQKPTSYVQSSSLSAKSSKITVG